MNRNFQLEEERKLEAARKSQEEAKSVLNAEHLVSRPPSESCQTTTIVVFSSFRRCQKFARCARSRWICKLRRKIFARVGAKQKRRRFVACELRTSVSTPLSRHFRSFAAVAATRKAFPSRRSPALKQLKICKYAAKKRNFRLTQIFIYLINGGNLK